MATIKASEVVSMGEDGYLVSAHCEDDNDGALDHRAAWDAIHESAKTGRDPSEILDGLTPSVLVRCRDRWDGNRVVVGG